MGNEENLKIKMIIIVVFPDYGICFLSRLLETITDINKKYNASAKSVTGMIGTSFF